VKQDPSEQACINFPKNLGATSKVLGARKVTQEVNPQILGATLQNLVAVVTWHPRFVHFCCTGLCVCKML
jgi:hypothetical protein